MPKSKSVKEFQDGQMNYQVPNGWANEKVENMNSQEQTSNSSQQGSATAPSVNDMLNQAFHQNKIETAQRVLNDLIARNQFSLLDLNKVVSHPEIQPYAQHLTLPGLNAAASAQPSSAPTAGKKRGRPVGSGKKRGRPAKKAAVKAAATGKKRGRPAGSTGGTRLNAEGREALKQAMLGIVQSKKELHRADLVDQVTKQNKAWATKSISITISKLLGELVKSKALTESRDGTSKVYSVQA